MRRMLLLMALLVLTGAPAALAQGGSSTVAKNPGLSDRQPLPAPVGHRQPRASDVPDEKSLGNPTDPNDPLSKENAALDRKIKSICRGC